MTFGKISAKFRVTTYRGKQTSNNKVHHPVVVHIGVADTPLNQTKRKVKNMTEYTAISAETVVSNASSKHGAGFMADVFGKTVDNKAYKTLLRQIAGNASKTRAQIWAAGCRAIWYIEKHGQITPANDLVAVLKADGSIRGKAVMAWLEAHSQWEYDKESKTGVFNKKKSNAFGAAFKVSPFDFAPPTEYKPLDLPATLSKLIDKAEKHAAQKNKQDVIPAHLLEALKVLTASADETDMADA